MNGRKVCVVAPVHVWDDVRVFHKEACSLADAGYAVSLIARAPEPRTVSGVRVVPSVGSAGFRPLRFLLSPVVAIQALLQGADIYHLHNPDTLPVAVLLRMCGRKVIYDTHEDFSRRILIRGWLPKPLRRPTAFLVSRMEGFVAAIANASIATQKQVVERLGRKALLVANPPRIDDGLRTTVSRLAQDIRGQACRVRAVYVGRVSAPKGLYEMVDALEIANRSASVRLWLIGPADERDLAAIGDRPGRQYVDYLPAMAQERAFAHVERADVGLVVFRDIGDQATSDPNKLYEYMAFGTPFIASGFDTWVRKLADVDAGWFVTPGSADEIAAALLDIAGNAEAAKMKGANGSEFTRQYNWETEAQKLLELYGGI